VNFLWDSFGDGKGLNNYYWLLNTFIHKVYNTLGESQETVNVHYSLKREINCLLWLTLGTKWAGTHILHAGEKVCSIVEHTWQGRSTQITSRQHQQVTSFSAVLVYASYIYNIKIYSSQIQKIDNMIEGNVQWWKGYKIFEKSFGPLTKINWFNNSLWKKLVVDYSHGIILTFIEHLAIFMINYYEKDIYFFLTRP